MNKEQKLIVKYMEINKFKKDWSREPNGLGEFTCYSKSNHLDGVFYVHSVDEDGTVWGVIHPGGGKFVVGKLNTKLIKVFNRNSTSFLSQSCGEFSSLRRARVAAKRLSSENDGTFAVGISGYAYKSGKKIKDPGFNSYKPNASERYPSFSMR